MKNEVSVFNPGKGKFMKIDGRKLPAYSGLPFAVQTIWPRTGYGSDIAVYTFLSPNGEEIKRISGKIDSKDIKKRFLREKEDIAELARKMCYLV
jgi:hypothetical protein